MTATPEVPTPLAGVGRELLDQVLGHDFPGVDALADLGCTCGCGTLDLVVADPDAPLSSAASPAPVEGEVHAGEGQPVGGLLLFVHDGLLNSLEIYSYGNDSLPLPDPEHVTWVEVPPSDV